MAQGTKDRARQTVRDLVISMAVVGAFVAFLFLIVLRPTPDPVKTVEVAGSAQQAQATGAFEVLVPQGLPPGWRATSARFTPGVDPGTGTWFNGYLNPDDAFVAVVQQDFDVEDFVIEQTDQGMPEGTVTIDGVNWQQYASAESGELSLVNVSPEVTTVVTGTVGYDQLEDFAGRLRPA